MSDRENELRSRIEANRRDEATFLELAASRRAEAERLEKELEALEGPPRHEVDGPHQFSGNEHFIALYFPTKERADYAKPILEKMNPCPPPFKRGDEVEYWNGERWCGTITWYGDADQLRAWHMGELRRKQ